MQAGLTFRGYRSYERASRHASPTHPGPADLIRSHVSGRRVSRGDDLTAGTVAADHGDHVFDSGTTTVGGRSGERIRSVHSQAQAESSGLLAALPPVDPFLT
jgi:hypothetical protein